LVNACVTCLDDGGKLMSYGNGGCAGDARHLATKPWVRDKEGRAAIVALALTTNTSVLTAIGNGFGFDMLFARQIEALAKLGDIAIGTLLLGKVKTSLSPV
jgi:D-sedoheptulose 7-phosphate isomerase